MCKNLLEFNKIITENFKVKPYSEVEKSLTEAAFKTLKKLAKQANEKQKEANLYAAGK